MREPTSWKELREALSVPTFGSTSRSHLGLWIVEELERQLGSDWPERASGAKALGGVLGIHRSNPAFFRLLALALRLASTDSLAGRRHLLKSLRRDFSIGSRLHTLLQLEVAVLAETTGWQASCEERLGPDTPPLDVVMRGPNGTIPVEAKVVLVSEANREIDREHSRFDDLFMRLLCQYDVIVGGNFPGIPTEVGRAAIESAVVPVAREAAANRDLRVVTVEGVDLTVTWAGAVPNGTISTMPGPIGNDAERLPRKITPKNLQAARSGARWLRLDMVSGYFQYSPWWNWPFALQVDAIAAEILAVAQDSIFDGVVVSSGPIGPGIVEPDRVEHSGGAIGLRQQLDPMHSRTTVVVPLTEVGSEEVAIWSSIYAAEANWLDAALTRFGLPSLAEVMARSADW